MVSDGVGEGGGMGAPLVLSSRVMLWVPFTSALLGRLSNEYHERNKSEGKGGVHQTECMGQKS